MPPGPQDDVVRSVSLPQTVTTGLTLVGQSAKHRTSRYRGTQSPVTLSTPHQPRRDDLPPAEELSTHTTQHVTLVPG